MAEQDRGVRGTVGPFGTVLMALWLAASSIAYGTAALCCAVLSNRPARALARLWCAQLLFLAGVKVKTIGLEKVDRKERYVFVANHQSYFDIPALYAGLRFDLSFIAKKELFFIPFFGWGIAVVGHIWIDRENARNARKSITRAVSKLKDRHISLVLFPEGTRSVTGEVGEFKRGSFSLALEAGVPVVPVSICGTRDVLPKKSLRLRPGTVRLVIGDPVLPAQFAALDKTKLTEIVKDRIVKGIEAQKNIQ